MAAPHHWPPQLSELVAQAVIRLNPSKRNVLTYFTACGVPERYLAPWRVRLNEDADSVRKLAMAEDIVAKINAKPDANDYIRMRREVIRRIVETPSFDNCWPDDQPIARGLVAHIRELVGERDTVTRIVNVTERLAEERRRARANELQTKHQKAGERDALRQRFYKMFSMQDGRERGYAFQQFLTDLFGLEDIRIREPFQISTREQIDGAIALDTHVYLVEAKWWAEKLSHSDVADLYIKVSGKALGTRGLVVSGSGYTEECVEVCQASDMRRVIFTTAEDLVEAFENELAVAELIRQKAEYAMTEGRILVGAREIIERLNRRD